MSEETPDVIELTLTDLGPEALDTKLTLAEGTLTVEAAGEVPLPDWLRGAIPFEGLDVVYVDPAAEAKGEDAEEDEEEESLPPGLRVTRVIEIAGLVEGETFPRTAALIVDGKHVDLAEAKSFAATFARLAGRELPAEAPAEAPPAEAAAPAAEEPTAAAPEPAPEAPAFAPPSDDAPSEPEEKAFV